MNFLAWRARDLIRTLSGATGVGGPPRTRCAAGLLTAAEPAHRWVDLRALFPVVTLLALGHVTSTLAPAYGTVAFSNIVKTAEPLFTCFFSFLMYR